MTNLTPLNIQFDEQEIISIAKQMAKPLLGWYNDNARELPWRQCSTPYRVWVSEIMLQQTRVEAVKPYFARFMETLPTIEALANADEETLMKLWEGLGYYSRVRNMQKAAKIVVEEYGGQLPGDYEQLLSLPGIGEYTAGAVGSIAYGLKVPAVDGNVYRVFARLFASPGDITQGKVKKSFFELVKLSLPEERIGDYNQALMELGATVCIPKGEPLCNLCPLADLCQGRKQGSPSTLPYKAPKKARKIEKRTVMVMIAQGKVLLHKRPSKGLLAGLWELPNIEGWLNQQQLMDEVQQLEIIPGSCYKLLESKHVFSHIEWLMEGYLIKAETLTELGEGYRWANLEECSEDIALPTAFKAYTSQFPKWL